MKQFLLALLAVGTFTMSASAQCTPDMSHAGDDGIHPDSATGFAPAYVSTAYAQTITVVIPQDTCAQIAPLPFPCTTLVFDSVIVTNVTGLPASFSFTCAPPNCRFLGNSIDCAIITGTAVTGDIGTHNLTFYISAYLGGFSTPNNYTVDYYKLVVLPAVGVEEQTAERSTQASPNPFSGITKIDYNIPSEGAGSFEVYNVFGQMVHSQKIIANRGNNQLTLDGSSLPGGTYFYKITVGGYTVTKRIIVSK